MTDEQDKPRFCALPSNAGLGDLLDDEMRSRGITNSKELVLSAENCRVCGSPAQLVATSDEQWNERGWIFTIECTGSTCPRCACGIHPQEAVLRWNEWQRRKAPNAELTSRAFGGLVE